MMTTSIKEGMTIKHRNMRDVAFFIHGVYRNDDSDILTVLGTWLLEPSRRTIDLDTIKIKEEDLVNWSEV